MNHMRTKRAWRVGVAALVFGSLVAVAGCTTDSGGNAGSAIADDDLGFLTQAQFDEITAEAEAAAEVPVLEIPSEPIDTAQLQGKKLFVFPSASFLEDCDTIAKQTVEAAEELGMTGTYFQTDGSPASWVEGMQQATSQGYDAIVMLCGVEPDLIGPQVEAATAAGITVVAGALYDTRTDGTTSPLLTAQTNSPMYDNMRAVALQALLDNRAEPFDVLIASSNEAGGSAEMAQAFKDTIEEYCSECGVQEVNVPLAEVATKMTPEVQSALVANPKIKVVVPIFGGTGATYAMSAITAHGASGVGVYGAYGMPIADIELMVEGDSVLKATTRHNNMLRMMTTVDQTLRAMTGAEIVDANVYVDPNRLVTTANAADFMEISNEGFGDEAVDAYRVLWGLN